MFILLFHNLYYLLHSFGSLLLRIRTFWLGVLKSDVQLTVL